MYNENSFIGYIWKWFMKGFLITGFIWAIFTIFQDQPEVIESESFWKNEDKSISPVDVSSYDYNNRVINYRDYNKSDRAWIYQSSGDEGIDIEELIDLYED